MSVKPSLQNVHDALASGLDQFSLTDGTTLNCSNTRTSIDTVSDAQIPFLLLQTGRAVTAEWTPFVYQVAWDIPGELKVKGEPGKAPSVARGVIDDLFGLTNKLRALFVDDQLQVHAYSDDTIKLYNDGKLTALAFRGGPFLKSFAARPVAGDSPFAIVDVVFHVDFLDDHDPATYGTARVFTVGATPVAPDRSFPLGDPDQQPRYQVPIPAYAQDTQGQGLFSGPDTTAGPGKANPPFGKPYAAPGGVDPRTLAKEIQITPNAATFAHTGTLQLSAISLTVEGVSNYVGSNGQWSSNAPGVATVNQSGLVTGVSAGTVAITCAFGGASGVANLILT